MTQTQDVRSRTFSWSDPMISATELGRRGGLELLQAMGRGELPAPPTMSLIVTGDLQAEAGRVVVTLGRRARLYRAGPEEVGTPRPAGAGARVTKTPPLVTPGVGAAPPAPPARLSDRLAPARLLRGRPDDPAWARPALLLLLAATTLLYLWDLGASGWGNSFYAAATQAGSESWRAWFFGSSDAPNFITLHKTPAA